MRWRFWTATGVLLCAVSAAVCLAESGRGAGGEPTTNQVEPTTEAGSQIDVKFRSVEPEAAPMRLLPPELRQSVASVRPLVTLGASELERMGAGRMARWFRLTLRPGTDAAAFLAALVRLDVVEAAEPAPKPAPPPDEAPGEHGPGGH